MNAPDPAFAAALKTAAAQARTVTGSNLQGTVRILSASEIEGLVNSTLKARLEQERATMQQALDAAKAEAEKARQELAGASAAEVQELHRRIAELEEARAAAAAERAAAVAAAEQAAAARIKELETLLASDKDRARMDFLEQEVQRLQALVDRYAGGMELVTALERPVIAEDMARLAQLQTRVSGPLALRLEQIKSQLEGADRALNEGLHLINEEHKGWIYAVTDLLEHSVAAVHLRQELLSIEQALGG